MTQQKSPAPDGDDTPPSSDPWQAVSYLLSGVLVYGLAGWGLDRWLGTNWIVAVGIIAGAALGVWMTWLRSGGGPRKKKHADE